MIFAEYDLTEVQYLEIQEMLESPSYVSKLRPDVELTLTKNLIRLDLIPSKDKIQNVLSNASALQLYMGHELTKLVLSALKTRPSCHIERHNDNLEDKALSVLGHPYQIDCWVLCSMPMKWRDKKFTLSNGLKVELKKNRLRLVGALTSTVVEDVGFYVRDLLIQAFTFLKSKSFDVGQDVWNRAQIGDINFVTLKLNTDAASEATIVESFHSK